ncbi:MAG: flagella synthesis protein FlgN [Crocinitomicaceae bacterium]|jgi:flagella synthesis protein FlgN
MSNPAADEMVELLTRELATLDQLKQVLDNESDALLKNDINAVEGSAHHKKSLLARFQKQVQARLGYLSAHGFESSEQGFESYIASIAPDQDSLYYIELNKRFQQLKLEFATVIKQNEKNGIVIHHSRNRTRALLNILHGHKNQPNLYNQSGSDKGNRQRHSLGEA